MDLPWYVRIHAWFWVSAMVVILFFGLGFVAYFTCEMIGTWGWIRNGLSMAGTMLGIQWACKTETWRENRAHNIRWAHWDKCCEKKEEKEVHP